MKPPKHMVKEYKQIHRVDWYEDYDDDDGGYSDIYDSDVNEEMENLSAGKLLVLLARSARLRAAWYEYDNVCCLLLNSKLKA